MFAALLLALAAVILPFQFVGAQDHEVAVEAVENSDPATENHAEEGKFNFKKTLMKHVMDSHELHFFELGSFHAVVPLPMILLSGNGVDVFFSNKLHEGEFKGYHYNEEHKLARIDGASFFDLSITKNVLTMLICVGLLMWLFISIAKTYRVKPNSAPSGKQNVFEIFILFVRDDVVKPILGEKTNRYLPFLLTAFFFIWMNNMLGLIPGFAPNVTGNIAVTMTLALFSFIIILASSNKHYWSHIFMPPGVPGFVKPILILVEFLGVFIKPTALTIRLFANISAGHMIIVSIVSLIFVFGEMNPGAGYGFSVVSLAFGIFMMFLELLVALLQAYIFTFLSALFISQAIEVPHGEHH